MAATARAGRGSHRRTAATHAQPYPPARPHCQTAMRGGHLHLDAHQLKVDHFLSNLNRAPGAAISSDAIADASCVFVMPWHCWCARSNEFMPHIGLAMSRKTVHGSRAEASNARGGPCHACAQMMRLTASGGEGVPGHRAKVCVQMLAAMLGIQQYTAIAPPRPTPTINILDEWCSGVFFSHAHPFTSPQSRCTHSLHVRIQTQICAFRIGCHWVHVRVRFKYRQQPRPRLGVGVAAARVCVVSSSSSRVTQRNRRGACGAGRHNNNDGAGEHTHTHTHTHTHCTALHCTALHYTHTHACRLSRSVALRGAAAVGRAPHPAPPHTRTHTSWCCAVVFARAAHVATAARQ